MTRLSRRSFRLGRRLPRSAVITFVGTLGIAALPPLNGFVSEWLIFQGLFQGFRTGSHLIAILIVLAAATLGLTGGLAPSTPCTCHRSPSAGRRTTIRRDGPARCTTKRR
jgi:hydrogenase-4 component B